MKKEIFVIAEKKNQYFFSIESRAAEKAELLNKKYQKQQVNEDVFDNMLKEKIFLDSEEYLQKVEKTILVDVMEEQEHNDTGSEEPQKNFIDTPVNLEEGNGIDLKEILKEINFLKNQLNVFEGERTELLSNLQEIKNENLKLKNKAVLNLEDAKRLYDRKQELLKNKSIFENALDNTQTVLHEMNNIIDFDENKSYRLTLNALNHDQEEIQTLFGISNNLVIIEVLKHISNKVYDKISGIESEVKEIENKFN